MSKQITNLREAELSLKLARRDLARVRWAVDLRDKMPATVSLFDYADQGLVKFYMSQWPQFADDPKMREKWSDQLDICLEALEKYVASVEDWQKRMHGRAVRCSLPKKKQRELGMLPSVENEINMRNGL